jgi:glycosyltransferase involved in cell wall biosynthesis
VKPNFLADDPGIGAGQGGYALFVGRLTPEKGIGTLLEAFRNESEIPLKVVGVGPEVERVREAAKQSTHIRCLGKLPHKEILKLMQEASILIFPSEWYETFGLVAIEAFACGLPVIAAEIGAPQEIIQHQHNGLHFKPGDVDDLRRQVRWAMAHPDALNLMRHNARRTFEEKYTAERNYELLLKIYEEAMLVRAQYNQAPRKLDGRRQCTQ